MTERSWGIGMLLRPRLFIFTAKKNPIIEYHEYKCDHIHFFSLSFCMFSFFFSSEWRRRASASEKSLTFAFVKCKSPAAISFYEKPPKNHLDRIVLRSCCLFSSNSKLSLLHQGPTSLITNNPYFSAPNLNV